MRFKATGADALGKALERHGKRLGVGFNRVAKTAVRLLVDTARPLAPIDTGALRASGVWFAEGSGFSTVAIAGFGAEVDGFYDDRGREKIPSEYAVYQHEYPWSHFYLERAVDEKYAEISTLFYTELAKA